MQNGQLCSLKYDPWYIAMHTKLYRGYSHTYSKNHMNTQSRDVSQPGVCVTQVTHS